MRNTTAEATYALATPSTFLKIDQNSGQLTLQLQIGLQQNNSKLNITATVASDVARTEIVIFVLPSHHGDSFAIEAVRAVRERMQNAKTITPQTIFVPAILDALLQQVAEGSPRTNISNADEIVENAIKLVKAALLQPYGKVLLSSKLYLAYRASSILNFC